jgi:hypothetical protein
MRAMINACRLLIALSGGGCVTAANGNPGSNSDISSPMNADLGLGSPDMSLGNNADMSSDMARITSFLTITVDATKLGYAIPANYVGLSFGTGNIAGGTAGLPIFDPTFPNHGELVNLFQQIGIKHIRTVRGLATATDPVPRTIDLDHIFQFAQAAGLGPNSIIFSFHLFGNLNPDPNDNLPQAKYIWSTYRSMVESFALGNESDWKAFFGTKYSAFTSEWNFRYDEIQSAIGSPKASFSGPDTGSDWPVAGAEDTSVGGPNGVPWSLQFARDEKARINLTTQHYYGGSTTVAPAWVPGSTYYAGDVVQDPKAGNFTYQCTLDLLHSNTHPQMAIKYWKAYPPIWASGTAYTKGDYVQTTDAKGHPAIYECIVPNCPSTSNPSTQTTNWYQDGGFGLLSALQMAKHMLSVNRLADYATLLSKALAQASGWPPGIQYRLTESNAFSGGQDPNSHCFATALWALDYFHWWAARGCAGVDPFTRPVQYNSAIFLDSSGHFVAEPLAYGMKAFAMGSSGTTVDPNGISFSANDDWVSGYGVVSASHLYVTLVNKSFQQIDSVDEVMHIKPVGFAAKQAKYLVLAAGAGLSGDAMLKSATLGNAPIPASGAWTGTWSPVSLNADGTIGPFTVAATTAVVVDITN